MGGGGDGCGVALWLLLFGAAAAHCVRDCVVLSLRGAGEAVLVLSLLRVVDVYARFRLCMMMSMAATSSEVIYYPWSQDS